ncbi:putative membrane protein YccC [Tsukamurella ocularis]|uniref:hypothetical protein n=1 Tax=Tsukamurella ocularis TaxID=1970234 RepID=UPI002168A6A1|nr:hypothetical protein [Tsukamurella ocularis]MCS3789954.1 putative membrane protein YccC [Tsukamurella ocularis]
MDDEATTRVTAMLEEVKRDALAGVEELRSTHAEVERLRTELAAAERRYSERHRALTDRSFFTVKQLSDLGLPAPKRRRAPRKKRT